MMEFGGRHNAKVKLPHTTEERVLRSPYYVAVNL